MIIDDLIRILNSDDSSSEILKILNLEEVIELNNRLLVNSDISFTEIQLSDIKSKTEILTSLIIIICNNPRLSEELEEHRQQYGINLKQDLYYICYNLYYVLFRNTNDIELLVYSLMYAVLSDKLTLINKEVENYLTESRYVDSNCSKLQYISYISLLTIFKLIKDKSTKDELIFAIKNLDNFIKKSQFIDLEDASFEDTFRIAGYSNINYMLKESARYILTGRVKENIYTVINTHSFNAIKLLSNVDKNFVSLIKILKISLEQLCKNSIWNLTTKSNLIHQFFHGLLEKENGFLYSLMPSQRDTVNDILTSKKSIVLNMPTSSGKTLISQISILYTIQNYREPSIDYNPTICYVVPTNALINQVSKKFREDFKSLNLNIETVLPFNDIDAFENHVLKSKHIDILVSTPEKLDFLIRNEHPCLKNLKQVIIDEAHNISEEQRGSKIELLLSTIKLLKNDINFLLMSPFIENAKQISLWLGGDKQNSLDITMQWSPTKQYVGCNIIKDCSTKSIIKYFPTPTNNILNEEIEIDLNNNPLIFKEEIGETTINNYTKSIIMLERYTKIGGTSLVLTKGSGVAQKLALKVLNYFKAEFENISEHPSIKELNTLIDLEMDDGHILKKTIEYGIAFHHAKLPNIIKTSIEDLVSKGLIKVLCATTTLAQGMNFPITTVIFDTLTLGGGSNNRIISNAEFWNIAGRAGRAYMDKEGHIIIKMHTSQKETIEKTKSLIKDRTKEILSSLGRFFDELDEYKFDYKLIKDNPAAQNFLQYLNHVLRVSYKYNLDNIDTTKIRNILDASLVFKEATYKEGFFEAQEKFSNFARSYIDNIKDKDTSRLKLADILGITNISLDVVTGLMLQHRKDMIENHTENSIDYINATKIVLDSQSKERLTPIINIINSIPEIKLALQGQGNFQPEQVAKLIISWVNGKHITEIAQEVKYDNEDYETVLDMCYKYINSTITSYVPWGISIYQQITNDNEDEAENLPSYIYYGVNNVESLIFSKIGIPRILVDDMINIYKSKYPEKLISIENINEIKANILNYTDDEFNILNKEASIIKSIVNKSIS